MILRIMILSKSNHHHHTMALSVLNWTAAGLHTGLGVFFSIYFPLINKAYPRNSQEDAEMTIRDHALLLTKVNHHINIGWTSVPAAAPTMNTVQLLVVLFFYITGLFHFIYASTPLYGSMIGQRNNWMRWVEYAITSTLMLYILAILCTVKDANVYYMLGSVNVIMISLGQMVEENIRNGTSPWLPILASFVLLFTEFGIIARDLLKRVNQVETYILSVTTNNTQAPLGPIPRWIAYMILVLFVFFSCFGLVSLYQCIYPETRYESIETAYVILSFVAKATLGGFIAYGTAWGQQQFT